MTYHLEEDRTVGDRTFESDPCYLCEWLCFYSGSDHKNVLCRKLLVEVNKRDPACPHFITRHITIGLKPEKGRR